MSETTKHGRGATCDDLRHKMMFITAPAGSDEGLGPSSLPVTFWCVKTQRGLGPDGEPVDSERCVDGRGCCAHG